jgi:mediator of RNA polymerase II transcription subunit 12
MMTSRPSLVIQRQPQRSLSGTGTIQRPAPHRTLSQQYPSSSPTRKNESFMDSTFEGSSEAAPGRYGTTPRNGGSRLKLEISKDSKPSPLVESPVPASVAIPSWMSSQPPRGRPRLQFDVPGVSDLSPGKTQEEHNKIAKRPQPMPMPMRPGQHAPPATQKTRAAPGNTAKKDARPKPYVLEVPTTASPALFSKWYIKPSPA